MLRLFYALALSLQLLGLMNLLCSRWMPAKLKQGARGVLRPVCFFSRKFNRHQVNYTVIEKEALALILALQHFEVYVDGSAPLVVYTDRNPLTFLS